MRPPMVGLLGGGQLGQMLLLEGVPLGMRFVVWDPDPQSPAGKRADYHICAPYSDNAALQELVGLVDLVTYEVEHLPLASVQQLEQLTRLPQGSDLLRTCQHRLREKLTMQQLQIPTAPFRVIQAVDDIREALTEWRSGGVLKTTTGGYDGKGQFVLETIDDAESAFQALHVPGRDLVLEGWVKFEREVSVLVARSPSGQVVCYPVAENLHENGILAATVVPARLPDAVTHKALHIAKRIAEGLRLVGVLGVEMFALADGSLLVNELAPRPHNSGHFTQDACNVSQFEQHLRAICDWPLVPPVLREPAVMLNLLGEHIPALAELHRALPPTAHLHWYDKREARPGRKMAHLNVTAPTLEAALSQLQQWNLRPLNELLENGDRR